MSIAIFISLSLVVVSKNELPKTEEKIPLLEVTGGERRKLGIDKNINETNIDEKRRFNSRRNNRRLSRMFFF